jgi:hypothetical protein
MRDNGSGGFRAREPGRNDVRYPDGEQQRLKKRSGSIRCTLLLKLSSKRCQNLGEVRVKVLIKP